MRASLAASSLRFDWSGNRRFARGLARAFGGALVFALPMLMTMEMWQFGFAIERVNLLVLILAFTPVLIGLSHLGGFEHTFDVHEDVRDTFVAYAVGFVAAGAILLVFGVVRPGMSVDEVIGKVALQALPASIGALLARSIMGGEMDGGEHPSSYRGELFLMAAGAIFLALNVAPTDEMVLISYKMSASHAFVLALGSLALMHAFVYAVEFRGQESRPEDKSFWWVFGRFTVVGYAIALLISLFILWAFGRTEGHSLSQQLMATVVLAFPASLGAAAARLII